ncbi:hypothetical protein GALMADRAFT_236723 [Galerina marginata CBS 339.88]|uniref:HIG1 domain-containing protein n=1 Tax=Galerina marginata (strain CBS 339.88) TaxID=685588 RepID=A0A067TLI7_GALM3|nr:hypothetical protein GALMADRAFT_236723 [Galerina marginata CBS 339.88]
MRPLTDKQLQEHDAASRRGALEGVLAGGTVAIAGSLYAQRYWHAYRRLPISLKAFAVVIIVAPAFSIQAERRGVQYERSQWTGEGLRVMDEKELRRMKQWDSMTLGQKIGDWSFRHQYSIIMGSWAASLGLAALIISRNKYQTYPQKIVQARMWAQGLTIGLIMAAGALTHTKRAQMAEAAQHDHSWMDMLEQQERDRREEAAAAAAASRSSGNVPAAITAA